MGEILKKAFFEAIWNLNVEKYHLSFSKSTWGEQLVEDIVKFTRIFVHVCMSVFIYVCHVSWPNEKRYKPEIWHTYSHWHYLKTFFLFFRSNHRDGRKPRKTAVSRGFSAYLLDCLIVFRSTLNIQEIGMILVMFLLQLIEKCFNNFETYIFILRKIDESLFFTLVSCDLSRLVFISIL